MNKCYLCDEPLSDYNHSLEHIIPNSIGGRLKSRSLICKICNNTTGKLFDAEFAKFGNILASKYNIKRETGVVQDIPARDLSSGEKLIVAAGYKVSYIDPKSQISDDFISVSHPDKRRTIEEMKRLSKQLDGKKIDEKDLEFEVVVDNSEKQFLIDFSFEPNLLLRSVCKTIVNLYLYKTGDYHNCQPIINFLREDIENRFCWFLDLAISKSKHKQQPHHMLIIKGEEKSKLLYAYFEIFGEVGFLTLLNGRYMGTDRQINYTFDPLNNMEVESDYDFSLKAGDIIQHLMTKPESEMIKCIHH